MTIEELKLANAIDTLIKEADANNGSGSYDNEAADYYRCDECHETSYDNGDDSFVDGIVYAYKEILKLLNKENDWNRKH